MEKKGEILNQLAIISDLIENVNLESKSRSVLFILNKTEFNKMTGIIVKKTKVKYDDSNQTFSVKIGEVEFIFTMEKTANKNNA